MVDHPELMDDFAGKVQFFRLMYVLIVVCEFSVAQSHFHIGKW